MVENYGNRSNFKLNLVGGLEPWNFIPYTGNVITPTDELIFFRGVQTTNQEVISNTTSSNKIRVLYWAQITWA